MHAVLRLPGKALVNKIDEVRLSRVCLKHIGERLRVRVAHFSFGIRGWDRIVVLVEEDFAAGGRSYHRSGRHTLDFHYALHLLLLVLSGEQRPSHVQLVHDAAEGPHVDCWRVADTHHDLGRSVVARLDVGVKLLILIRARAEVNDFDP